MKTCEICGKSIKSGRKYCWEHRHTAQANAIRGDRLIDEATEGYKIHKTGFFRNRNNAGFIFIPATIILFVAMGFLNGANYLVGGVLVLLGIILFVYVIWKMYQRKKIFEGIGNEDEEYASFVKDYIGHIRERGNFRKSLLE